MHRGTITATVLIGLLVGILVGLTGIGGGLLPLPMSALGVPPVVAVGSDAVSNCVTKIGAGGLHWYRGNVKWPFVFRLAYGSVPGALFGILVLARIREAYPSAINDFLRIAVGALLIVIPILYLAGQLLVTANHEPGVPSGMRNEFGIAIIGFVAGLLVAVTSIGAGSVILLILLIFYGLPPAATVGTDVIQGVLLAGITGLLQFKLLGNVVFLRLFAFSRRLPQLILRSYYGSC